MFGQKEVTYNNISLVEAISYTYSIKACHFKLYKSGYYFDIIPWLGYRIQQAKINMHPTHNRAYTDSLIEIETLNWVLNEIVVLLKRNPDG